jgi:type VI secretion system protein ImpG
MDRRLLNFYNLELQHLRETAAEFAREFPKIAGRLSLDPEGRDMCPDPFVERLLEGFAFLTARVHLKLDAEFPRFTQAILESVYPHYLSPTPSMVVAQFTPDAAVAQMENGFLIPRGSALKAEVATGERTACEYRTAHAVELWPIRLTEAQYYTRDVASLDLPREFNARAALRIRLQTQTEAPFNSLKLDRLSFFLRGADEVPVLLLEQIFSHATGIVVQAASDKREKSRVFLGRQHLRRVGFREDEALLPYGPRGFQGYRFLHEYFAFPQRFLFFEINGLSSGLAKANQNEIDILIPMKEQEIRLEERIDASSVALFCSPAINLFPMHADRIRLNNRFSEHQVIMDRTRPNDFEVHSVEQVTGYGIRSDDEQRFYPFYTAREKEQESGSFFTLNRVSRVLSAKERRTRGAGSYAGTEVYISLVDAKNAPFRGDLEQLGLRAYCTNRHLPLQLAPGVGRSDFSLKVHAPIQSIRCVTRPTPPRPPFAEGAYSWRVISHLSLNYLSLLDSNSDEGALGLRELLNLYTDPNDQFSRKQIEGVRSTKTAPIVRRAETPGPISFVRGVEISVLFDESLFEGAGIFLLGSVLEQFFARYVSLNSFTETVVKSQQRGEIIRWPPQMGHRQLI